MLFNYDKTNGMTVGGTSIGSFFTNQNKNILSEGNNQAFLDKMSNTEKWNAPTTTSDWIASQAERLGDVNEQLVTYVQNAKAAGTSASQLESGWVSQTSAATKLSGVVSKLGDTTGKVIATVGNALVSMGATAIISLAVQGVQNLINSYDDLAERVGEITTEYTTARDTVDDYTSKLVNIRAKLEDESTTTEEAAQMTQQLYDIQNDLIGTYGSYAAGLDLVNGKLETQVGILQDINKQNLQKWENEANSVRSSASSGINVAANAFENVLTGGFAGFLQSGKILKNVQGGQGWIEAIKNSWTESDVLGNDLGRTVMGSSLKQIRDRMEEFNATIDATDSDKINEIINSFDAFSLNGDKINVSGSVNEVSDAVVQLQVELKNLGYANDNLDAQLSAIAKTTSDYINTSGDAYNNTLFTEIMRTDTLAEKYVTLTEAYHKFKEAQDSGDTEGVNTATKDFTDIWGTLTKDSNVTSDMLKYFKSLYPELQSAISDWELEVDVIPNIKDTDLEDYIAQNSYEQIFTDFLKWGNEEIEVPSSVENYFNTLQEYSEATGVDILQLIKLLQQLDDFDMSKAEGKLKDVFQDISKTELSDSYNEAIQSYKKAVEQYDKVNAGDFKLGSDQGKYTADDGRTIIFKTKFTDANGKVTEFSADEVSSYIDNIIKQATDQTTGEIDWSKVWKMDKDEFVAGGGLSNMIDWGTTNNNQAQIQAIQAREEAWASLRAEAEAAGENIIKAQEKFDESEQWSDERIENFVKSLSENPDDLKTFLSMDLDEISKYQTEEELRQAIEEAQKIADENKVEVKTYANQAEALDSMEDAFGGLATTYETSVTNGEKVSSSDLQQVNSDMGGVTFNTDDVSSINVMSNALEQYNETLIKYAGNSIKAQEAADKLATAYVDQSGVLDNLLEDLDHVTDAEKDYVKEQLTAQGITNADEVVESRLTKRYKAHASALQSVSKQVAQYRNNLEQMVDTHEDVDGTASKMISSVQELLSTYDDEGNITFSPDIDESFIIDNLQDIMDATEGDIDAFNSLMSKVAELNAQKILIDAGIDDATAIAEANNIMSKVAEADAMDIEVGASIDDAPFLAALSNMISGAQSTANAVVSAFESMGYTVEWNDKKTTATVPEITNTQGSGNSNIQAMRTSALQMNVPELKITRRSSAGGSKVTYGGGGGSSSGSGGGGGGDSGSSDNKKTEDDEETYDWIEVYIQRLEEELDRLDEIVDSTYTSWSKRNNTLKKELKNLNSQIEANNTAYDNYISKANSIQVNDGKTKVDDDDYGDNDSEQKTYDQGQLDTAISEWATGKYQKLIQEGKLGTDAIEKIQNTYLKNTIEA